MATHQQDQQELIERLETELEIARSSPVTVELMQRIFANLYYDEEEAGNTFQATLNDVADWLGSRGALPSVEDNEDDEIFDPTDPTSRLYENEITD